jgi:DNA-binding transcriptional ArsR family regulator
MLKGAFMVSQNDLSQVKASLPSEETIYNLAEFFKVFSDPTRAKILSLLEIKEMYVNEIADVLEMSISAISHQLRILRGAKLVKGKKIGKEVIYSLDDDHVSQIIECGLSHINE